MAVTAKWYEQALKQAWAKTIDWSNDSIKVMLCTSAYVPDQDNDVLKDVSITNEVSGTGYTVGGVALTSKQSPIKQQQMSLH